MITLPSGGDITTDDEGGKCATNYSADDCNFRSLFFKEIYSHAIFLTAETRGHHDNPIGRGGFWGDLAGLVTADYLTDCEQNQKCKIVQNKNGVSFAVYEADPPPEEMGYQPERYYVYNPNNQYYGVVLSSNRLDTHSPENNRLFKETVIESFEFFQ